MVYDKYDSNSRRKPRSFDRKRSDRSTFGLKVYVQHGDIDKALRKLKKKVNNAGVIKELKEREYHQKPSEKRRVEKARAIARWKKKVSASEKYLSFDKNKHRKRKK